MLKYLKVILLVWNGDVVICCYIVIIIVFVCKYGMDIKYYKYEYGILSSLNCKGD